MTHPLVFGLGSNVGDREGHLTWALRRLAEEYGTLHVGPLVCSRAISPIPQEDYLNTVAVVHGTPKPCPRSDAQWLQVVAQLKSWEGLAGRLDGPRFGPRPLDIDLLMWGHASCTVAGPNGEPPEVAGVLVPHPRWAERRFVLEPLAALCPQLRPPGQGLTVAQRLAALADEQDVELLAWDPRLLPDLVVEQP